MKEDIHTTDEGTEVRIKASGVLRKKMDKQASMYRGGKHELGHEVLTRMDTRVVIRNDEEADAVQYVLDRVSELEHLSGAEEKAAKRIRTRLITAKGDLLLA